MSTITVKSRHLSKGKVKRCLSGSSVKSIKVKVGKAKANKKYAKKYAKAFKKSNSGKKVMVRR